MVWKDKELGIWECVVWVSWYVFLLFRYDNVCVVIIMVFWYNDDRGY